MPEDPPAATATTLPDGTPARIRPLGPDDAPLLRDGMHRLSERSRRLRFHSAVTDLTDAQLRTLVELDQHDRVALAADVLHDGRYHSVGVARYAPAPTEEGPEFAIVVEDAFQGRGVGRLLLRELFATARANGFDRLTAEILAENDRILRLVRDEAREVELRRDRSAFHAVVHV